MRKTIYQTIKAFLLVCLVILGACQKEKNNSPANNCPMNISTIAGNYSITSIKYKVNEAPEQDYMQFMDACERDDIIFLSANGTYNHMDKGKVCSPDGNETGTWSLNGNKITSDDYINGTIEKFDCKVLVIYLPDIFVPGDRMTFVFTRE